MTYGLTESSACATMLRPSDYLDEGKTVAARLASVGRPWPGVRVRLVREDGESARPDSRHPAVDRVAVVAVPDGEWGEAVKAVVVARPGSAPSEPELIEWCRARIASFKKPRSVDFVDALPENANGKVLKRELRERYWSAEPRRVR